MFMNNTIVNYPVEHEDDDLCYTSFGVAYQR